MSAVVRHGRPHAFNQRRTRGLDSDPGQHATARITRDAADGALRANDRGEKSERNHCKHDPQRDSRGFAEQVLGSDGTAERHQHHEEVDHRPGEQATRLKVVLAERCVTDVGELNHDGKHECDQHMAPAESGEKSHDRGSVMTATTPRGELPSSRSVARSP